MKLFDFKKLESKWQKTWDSKGAFDVETDAKKKKFFLTTPYPYISGSLHIGHGRAIIEADIYSRYKRMVGYNVLFPMGFHISGMPVMGIATAIKNGDSKVIALYEEYVLAYIKDKKKVEKTVKSFSDPLKIVKFFIPKMIGEYKGLGVGVDWRRSFTSGDAEHRNLVGWQFENYEKKGYVVRGKHPVLYSPHDQSALGEDDIQDADSNPVDKVEFTLVKFRLGSKYLVAATLRPETVFGVTNIWIHPKAQYVEARVGTEIWIMTKEAFDKLSYQRKDLSFLGLTSEQLLGNKVHVPLAERSVVVLPSKVVDPSFGTGIVMSVPSDAPYDYVALAELQENLEIADQYGIDRELVDEIDIIPIIQTQKFGDKAGVDIVEKHGIVLHDDPKLEKLTQEVYSEGYHTGVMLDLCGPYSGMRVREAKDKIKHDLMNMHAGSIFYETSRPAVSRSGGKVIVAVLDNQWFIDFNAPGWKEKARECLAQMTLLPETKRKQFEDIFDWLDKRPCARKRGLGTPLPFDKSWMIESLSDSTLYMVLYTFAHLLKKYKIKEKQLGPEFFDFVLLGKGTLRETSKKLKIRDSVLKDIRASFQYWMPNDQRHTYSLHLSNHLSFMIFAYAALLPSDVWPKKLSFHGLVISDGQKMSKSRGNVITLKHAEHHYGADVIRLYLASSTNLEGTFDWRETEAHNIRDSIVRIFDVLQEAIKSKPSKATVSKLFVSRFNSLIREASLKLEEMKLREYSNTVIHEMLRLVKDAKLSLSADELAAFYRLIVKDWITMLTPVCPHIAEELWSLAKGKGLASHASWPKYDEKKIDLKLEDSQKALDKSVEDILNIIKLVRDKQGKEVEKVYLYVLPNEVLNYSAKLLSARVGKVVHVYAVNDAKKHDPQGKASKAKPGKPGIYVE